MIGIGASAPKPAVQHSDQPTALEFWTERGLQPQEAPDGSLTGAIPDGIISISGDELAKEALTRVVKHLDGPPSFFTLNGTTFYFYRVDDGFPAIEAIPVAPGIVIADAGTAINLPADIASANTFRAATKQEIPAIGRGHEWYRLPNPTTLPEVTDTPLAALSLRGQASQFELAAIAATPLLGTLCLAGQATMLYAPPNGGKTAVVLRLVLDAVQAGRIAAGNIYYVNADDNSQGFATKLRLLDDLGAHTLCPGFRDFKASELGPKLSEMGRKGKATGTLTIIDTTKKFTDLMHKREASQFAQACRQYVMGGGTIVALAHTNKNPTASGKLNYAGTADLLQDFDAAYIGTPLQGGARGDERVIRFEAIKRRGGPGEAEVAFAFGNGTYSGYEELLASVREVDPEQLKDLKANEAQLQDSEVIAHVQWCIGNGIVKKMDLVKAVADRANISQRAALKVIEGYTGSQPGTHHWQYSVRERGAKIFELLTAPAATEVDA